MNLSGILEREHRIKRLRTAPNEAAKGLKATESYRFRPLQGDSALFQPSRLILERLWQGLRRARTLPVLRRTTQASTL